MVTITTSPLRAASFAVTAFAPVSAAKSRSVSGPRELATKTLCPSVVRRRVNVPPIFPAPIIPMFIGCSFSGDVLVPRTKFLQEQIQKQSIGSLFCADAECVSNRVRANTGAWRIWTNVQELEFLAPVRSDADATEFRNSMSEAGLRDWK